ncbi:Aluminum-activated malate transporter 13 [Linum perenne]
MSQNSATVKSENLLRRRGRQISPGFELLKVGNDDPRRAIHTVPEFTAGATLCKGLNRGLGTVFRAIFIGSAVFTIGFATSIEACVNEYFREDGGQEEDKQGSDDDDDDKYDDQDLICKGYKAVLDSKLIDEALAFLASWEPRHSNHCRYPWQQYVKVGAALRRFSYTVVALHGCLQTEIQVHSYLVTTGIIQSVHCKTFQTLDPRTGEVIANGAGCDVEHLGSIPNRVFANGKSSSSCIFTQQGRKGINQDAMLVWEDFMIEDKLNSMNDGSADEDQLNSMWSLVSYYVIPSRC